MDLIQSMASLAGSNIESSETLELCDYGIDQSTSELKNGTKRKFWHRLTQSSTSTRKALDHVIVVITDKQIKFIPVKIGKFGNRWKQESSFTVDEYPRGAVKFSANGIRVGEEFGQRRLAEVEFHLPDGDVKIIELYNSPGKWKELAAQSFVWQADSSTQVRPNGQGIP